VLLRFDAEPASIKELEFRMRVDDRVLRYMTSIEVPEGAGYSEELLQLTERKERERRGRGGRGGRGGGGRGRPDRDREGDRYRGGPDGPRESSEAPPAAAPSPATEEDD